MGALDFQLSVVGQPRRLAHGHGSGLLELIIPIPISRSGLDVVYIPHRNNSRVNCYL